MAKSKVPDVSVNNPQFIAETAVVVPDVLLIVIGPAVPPLQLIVPVPNILAVKIENEPLGDTAKLFKFTVVAVPAVAAPDTALAVVPKSSLLNQLLVIIVINDAPLPVNVTFGELVIDPPAVLPNCIVLVIDASVTNPPVPV